MLGHTLGAVPPWSTPAARAGTGTSFSLTHASLVSAHQGTCSKVQQLLPTLCGPTGCDRHTDGKQDTARYLPQDLGSLPERLVMRGIKRLQLLAMSAQRRSPQQTRPCVMVMFLKGWSVFIVHQHFLLTDFLNRPLQIDAEMVNRDTSIAATH